jgi:hypothetical protein
MIAAARVYLCCQVGRFGMTVGAISSRRGTRANVADSKPVLALWGAGEQDFKDLRARGMPASRVRKQRSGALVEAGSIALQL